MSNRFAALGLAFFVLTGFSPGAQAAGLCRILVGTPGHSDVGPLFLEPATERNPLPAKARTKKVQPRLSAKLAPPEFQDPEGVEELIAGGIADGPRVTKSFESRSLSSKEQIAARKKLEQTVEEIEELDSKFDLETAETGALLGRLLALRAHDYFVALGIAHSVDLTRIPANEKHGAIDDYRIVFSREGDHPVNRFAKMFFERHGESTLIYQPGDLIARHANASFQPSAETLMISNTNAIRLRLEDVTLLHELRHSRNLQDWMLGLPSPYYGSADALGEILPGQGVIAYEKHLGFSEMLTFSHGLKNALNLYKAALREGDPLEIERAARKVLHNVDMGLVVSERVFQIAELALSALDRRDSFDFLVKNQRPAARLKIMASDGKSFMIVIPLLRSEGPGDPNNTAYAREQIGFLKRAAELHWNQFDLASRALSLDSSLKRTDQKLLVLNALGAATPLPNWRRERQPRLHSIEGLINQFNDIISQSTEHE